MKWGNNIYIAKLLGGFEIIHVVLVCSGCYKKVLPQTGWLKLQHVFLTVPEAGKSKIQVLADPVLGKDHLSGLRMATFLLCPHVASREREREREHSVGSLLTRTLLSPQGPRAHDLVETKLPCLKAPSPNTTTFGVRASTYDFWGVIQFIAHV